MSDERADRCARCGEREKSDDKTGMCDPCFREWVMRRISDEDA